MEDLYDGKKDSFVAGMAAGGSGQGIFSFARYDPLFSSRALVDNQEDEFSDAIPSKIKSSSVLTL